MTPTTTTPTTPTTIPATPTPTPTPGSDFRSVYSQSAGTWVCSNSITTYSSLYSGGGTDPDPAIRAQYRNNPAAEDQLALGPIPRGRYTIFRAVTPGPCHTGQFVLALTPDTATTAFINSLGRQPLHSFYLHGDNKAADFSASDGCIIAPYAMRSAVDLRVSKGDNQLEVVA